MYITWLRWQLGALKCNKARRTGLFPGTVVALGEVHPVGCTGFVFGERNIFKHWFYPIHALWGREEGLGPEPKAGSRQGLSLQGLQ